MGANWLRITFTLMFAAAQVSLPAPAREAYANLPGVRIWYKDTGGAGVPVVLMHAATGSSQVWEHQIPAFTAAGYRVIAYDRLGWGRSVIDSTGAKPGSAAGDLQAQRRIRQWLRDRLHRGRRRKPPLRGRVLRPRHLVLRRHLRARPGARGGRARARRAPRREGRVHGMDT